MKQLYTILTAPKREFFAILAVGLLVGPMVANAQLIDVGDSTIDTNTGLEWLDLTLTTGQSYNGIIGGFGGYTADGWVHPTTSQVCTLFGSLGDAVVNCVGTGSYAVDFILPSNADVLVSLLGDTHPNPLQTVACGFYNSGLIDSGRLGLAAIQTGHAGGCLTSQTPTLVRSLTSSSLVSTSPRIGHWLVRLATGDTDRDFVLDEDDLCPDTAIPEGVPIVQLHPNHWALTDHADKFDFDTVITGEGKGPNRSYTVEDTAGCSCEQIIEAQGLGNGQTYHGCSTSAMDNWVEFVNQ